MKKMYAQAIDARYWTAITLASVFGTNPGDLYARGRTPFQDLRF